MGAIASSPADVRSRRLPVADVVAAVVLSAAAIVGLISSNHNGLELQGGALAVIFTLLLVVPVAFSRTAPLAAAACYAAGGIASWAIVGPQTRCGAALPAAFWIACAIGLRLRGRRALTGMALVVIGIASMGRVDTSMDFNSALVLMVPIAIGFWFGGRTVRARAIAVSAAREQNREIAATRERTAQLAVEADRATIADGLDELLHQRIAGMAEQAEVGRAQADSPAAAQQAFATIADDGRDTLQHLRRVVGTLRSDAPLQPQPDLSRLNELVTGAGGALTIDGAPTHLPPVLELSAYRIVEQLLRDAGSSAAQVTIRFAAEALELQIIVPATQPDPALETPAPDSVAAERAALHGGTLTRSRQADTWQWVARLPITAGHALA